MDHEFTENIIAVLYGHFGKDADEILARSDLIQYLNYKTRSASRDSKARGSFANIYAIYVLVEDYLKHDFDLNDDYSDYEGAQFSDLLQRQRELPFGSKLQNHALNHRLNQEFQGHFPRQDLLPIIRDRETSRNWVNERLLLVEVNDTKLNISRAVIDIVDAYIENKQGAFRSFIDDINHLRNASREDPARGYAFIHELLRPNVDARIFEIVSYAILKNHYDEQTIHWGWTLESIQEETLILYKTGRTNANDGGIDFVMKPLGRFFQVTETTDIAKYFLDIDKVLRFPITFVIKSDRRAEELTHAIQKKAEELYPVKAVVAKYMSAIEEVISIPKLLSILTDLSGTGRIISVIDEILVHSQVEFNFSIRD